MDIHRGENGEASRRFAGAVGVEAGRAGISPATVYAVLGMMFVAGRGTKEMRPHIQGLSSRAGIAPEAMAKALDVIEVIDRGLSLSVVRAGGEVAQPQEDVAALMVSAVDDVFTAYNAVASQFGWVVAARSDRVARDSVVAALSDFGPKGVAVAIEKAAKSKFLCNRLGGGWRPTLAWMTKPDTILKIDEGFYDDQQRAYRK